MENNFWPIFIGGWGLAIAIAGLIVIFYMNNEKKIHEEEQKKRSRRGL